MGKNDGLGFRRVGFKSLLRYGSSLLKYLTYLESPIRVTGTPVVPTLFLTCGSFDLLATVCDSLQHDTLGEGREGKGKRWSKGAGVWDSGGGPNIGTQREGNTHTSLQSLNHRSLGVTWGCDGSGVSVSLWLPSISHSVSGLLASFQPLVLAWFHSGGFRGSPGQVCAAAHNSGTIAINRFQLDSS